MGCPFCYHVLFVDRARTYTELRLCLFSLPFSVKFYFIYNRFCYTITIKRSTLLIYQSSNTILRSLFTKCKFTPPKFPRVRTCDALLCKVREGEREKEKKEVKSIIASSSINFFERKNVYIAMSIALGRSPMTDFIHSTHHQLLKANL